MSREKKKREIDGGTTAARWIQREEFLHGTTRRHRHAQYIGTVFPMYEYVIPVTARRNVFGEKFLVVHFVGRLTQPGDCCPCKQSKMCIDFALESERDYCVHVQCNVLIPAELRSRLARYM